MGTGIRLPVGTGHRNLWGQPCGSLDLVLKTDGAAARRDPSAPGRAASHTAMATPTRALPPARLPTNQRGECAVSEPIRSEDGSAEPGRTGPSRSEPAQSGSLVYYRKFIKSYYTISHIPLQCSPCHEIRNCNQPEIPSDERNVRAFSPSSGALTHRSHNNCVPRRGVVSWSP